MRRMLGTAHAQFLHDALPGVGSQAQAVAANLLEMRVVDEPFELEGFALCHHPRPRRGHYVLAGHLHPCVSLGNGSFDQLRLPCFWLADEVGVLPAFGAFTGTHPIRAGASDRVFAIAEGVVAAMPRRVVASSDRDRRAA